ncbi:uncharacterized protein AB675_4048 [Cyphellophora attinorum]|uniref:DUF6590 domain-containing protein n=1 Tax=Cyphellophora attinorum TaxID=1664694 RepID=A0A0N0NJY4_9EURO|nr:uncharacterized protein AB675_4048 [Phialophora attinorum]KPI37521.1 hypothetical protein AB675_4048 [Phialophora attinorum]
MASERKGKGRHEEDETDLATSSAAPESRVRPSTSTTASRHDNARSDVPRSSRGGGERRAEGRQQHNSTTLFPRNNKQEHYSYSESDESEGYIPRHAEALIKLNPTQNNSKWRDFIKNNPLALEDEDDKRFYFAEAIDALRNSDVARAQSCVRIGTVLHYVGGKKPHQYRRLFDILAGDVADKGQSDAFESSCTTFYNDCKAKSKSAEAKTTGAQSASKSGARTTSGRDSTRHDVSRHDVTRQDDTRQGFRAARRADRHDDLRPPVNFSNLSLGRTLDPQLLPNHRDDEDSPDLPHGGRPLPRPRQDSVTGTKPTITGSRNRHDDDPGSVAGGGKPSQQPRHNPSAGGRETEIESGELDREPSITGPKASAPDEESLDPRFIRRETRKAGNFFKIGRIFAVLEHVEEAKDADYTTEAKWETRTRFGMVLTHIRHFAVVREGHGFCWAVPINTYNGQGLKKRGLRPVHITAHAIIYSTSRPPRPLPQEPAMSKTPIAIDLGQNADELKPSSRINFAQVHTIQHNVRAMNIGRVRDSSSAYFDAYWREHLLR